MLASIAGIRYLPAFGHYPGLREAPRACADPLHMTLPHPPPGGGVGDPPKGGAPGGYPEGGKWADFQTPSSIKL